MVIRLRKRIGLDEAARLSGFIGCLQKLDHPCPLLTWRSIRTVAQDQVNQTS